MTRTIKTARPIAEQVAALALVVTDKAETAKADASKAGANKARNKADDRNRKAQLMLTREALLDAGKATARTIARAQETISKAGLALMWAINGEGAALATVAHEYDKDIAPIIADTVAAAYPDSNGASQRTWRAYAKLFWLAGVHGIDSDQTTISKLTDDFRDQLKAKGVLEPHANDKAKETRAPRGAVAKGNPAPVAKGNPAPVAPVAPVNAPKVVTPADMQAAALLLTGNAVMAQQLVEAITLHRDQLAKALAAITTE